MPNHKSCKKRMKTSAVARQRNRGVSSRLRKAVKDLRAVTNPAEAQTQLKEIYSIIDKAHKNGILHKNKAARDKSRLTAHVKQLASPSETKA